MSQIILVLVVSLLFIAPVVAQSPNGTISGMVVDPSGGVIVGAEILIVSDVTNLQYSGKTNIEGIYVVANLPPGPYRLQVSRIGFKTLVKPDIVLHVQDALAINFTLPIGATSETVTVRGGVTLLNTETAAVSTVVDRQFVENLPLNGRSFQTLIGLTPGVVITAATPTEQGQFSVNGQRADANYFTVDGVSANIAVSGGGALGQSAAGALPGFSVLGGTNTLVSVDAMQEFRIQTSSFAPEFGNTPGGQVSIVTRSGTNDFHGTLFEYFRNDALDANDWFANHNGLAKPPERQNDFGGVIGGPIIKDRTFFFFSYEGLRLRQPQVQETVVPDTTARQEAPPAIQTLLNAFPIQNGPELGNDLAGFNASFSIPSTLDAYSLRVDHTINSKLAVFGRYNCAPSQVVAPTVNTLSETLVSQINAQTLTLGLTGILSHSTNNEFRVNYSNYRAGSVFRLDSFGGALPPADSALFPTGFSSKNGVFVFSAFGAVAFSQGKSTINEQRQVNVVDNLSVATGAHQLKFGVDYRRLSPIYGPLGYEQLDLFFGLTGPTGALSGVAPVVLIAANQSNSLLSEDYSFYGQDTWKVMQRLTLTYGLRWDINPPLKGKNLSNDPFTVTGLNNPANLALAPRGTPLYNTTYGNFAPRLGVAYQLTKSRDWETVLRAGFGVFYDLGSGSLGNVTQGFPYSADKVLSDAAIPLSAQEAAPPAFSLNPPVSLLHVAEPNLKLPRTYEWNVALEQSAGPSQTVSFTYVGAHGRDLLRQFFLESPNPNFDTVFVTGNTGDSDYNAFQIKLQRRLSHGLQALASYTFAHSIDNSSNDSGLYTAPQIANPNVDRASSDFDVRHTLTSALIYNIPSPEAGKFARAILGDWSVDTFVFVRSALPVDVFGANAVVGPVQSEVRPDIVPGQPLYIRGPQCVVILGMVCPGGKAFNGAAFTPAPSGQQGDFGRNVLRGFGAWQADFALHRQYRITERLGLQFRAEFFNIFNHPNFGDPTSANRVITSPLFGLSTENLASSLGTGGVSGGFNPLYQVGGPRSIQLALKLLF